jgi:AraC-like DNA-binding protein
MAHCTSTYGWGESCLPNSVLFRILCSPQFTAAPPNKSRGLPLNRYELLHATRDLSVRRFDHPPHEAHCDPEWEVASRWAIAFVRAGSFDVLLDGTPHQLSEGSVFLTRPGLEFRCQHADPCPSDVCLSIGFEPGAVSGAEHAWECAGWAARAAAPPRLAYVDRRMARAAADEDQFELERWALAALTALESDTRDPMARGHYAARRADVDAVVDSCRAIETDPISRRSIADRARNVGLTSTRLTHYFRRYLGVSPHQYVMRWRLAASAELLESGLGVSESCYRSGFENLSHFCRTFQRTFGVRASTWRTLAFRERRRKVQDLGTRRL